MFSRLTVLLVSALFISVYGSSCEIYKTSYLDTIKEYVEKYDLYEQVCTHKGEKSIKSCKDMGYECWFSGYRYFETSAKFMIDFPELAQCVLKLEECLTEDAVLSKECYACDRYLLYFYEAIVDDEESPTTQEDCCETTGKDCYEFDAWQDCKNATIACEEAWEAECISHTHGVWVSFLKVCNTLKSYFASCKDASLIEYCKSLTGSESYSKSDCVKYASKLSYCPAALKIDSGEMDGEIQRAEKFIHQVDYSTSEEFLECLEDLNIEVPKVSTDMAVLSFQDSQYSTAFAPFVTTLSAGLLIGLLVGIAVTKKRGRYQHISL